MDYVYSATENNGRITSRKDWVSGEEVVYQYDSLQRLISAATTGPEWGQSFSYDGFGNLLSQTVTKGSAPGLSLNVNASNNRITTGGHGYDANGNLTAMPMLSMTYDVENRVVSATHSSNGTDNYGYDPSNRRVWKNTPQGERTFFYGVDGTRMATYGGGSSGSFGGTWDNINVYFAGKLVWQEYTDGVGPGGVVVDRLGSVIVSPPFSPKLFPYGEEASTTQQDRTKYATYYRDATTALDYANQRYYGRTIGRFLTPDPYGGSASPANPQSWNRYAYVQGDPVNFNDPSGLFIAPGPYEPPPVPYDPSGILFDLLYSQFQEGFSEGLAVTAGVRERIALTMALRDKSRATATVPQLGGSPSRTQSQQFNNAMKRALSKLMGDCAKLFGDNGVSTLESAGYTLGIVFKPDSAAPDENVYAATNPEAQSVTINNFGHFFNVLVPSTTATGEPAVRDWRMATGLSENDFRAFVLLHELGHLAGKLGDDRADPGLGDTFNKSILSDCFGKKTWNPNP